MRDSRNNTKQHTNRDNKYIVQGWYDFAKRKDFCDGDTLVLRMRHFPLHACNFEEELMSGYEVGCGS